jgi:hypothetical protein
MQGELMLCSREAVQCRPVVEKRGSGVAFVSDELGRCPLAVSVLPCGFSFASPPFSPFSSLERCGVLRPPGRQRVEDGRG